MREFRKIDSFSQATFVYDVTWAWHACQYAHSSWRTGNRLSCSRWNRHRGMN